MQRIKKIKQMITYNLKSLVGFELLYKLVSTIIFVPLFLTLFKFITKITGYSYLTLENLGSFITNPLTILFLVLLIFLMTFYTIIDISTVIIILDCSYEKVKVTIKDAFLLALKKSLKLFNYHNILLPFLVLFLIPFLNIGITSSFISTISIPEFIMDFITHNNLLLALYIVFIIILAIILFRWLYATHYYVLEDCGFREARKKSINLSRREKFKDLLCFIGVQILLIIISLVFILLSIFLIYLLYKLLGNNILSSMFITIIWLFILITNIVLLLLATPLSYAVVSSLYYSHKEKKHEKIKHVKIKEMSKKNQKRMNIFKLALVILVILSGTFFTYSLLHNKYDLKIEYIRTMNVTAHRGASVNYPENTMAAFVGAKEEGADWIELDVQQTKDKQLIVLHDTNLKRTTGVNKNTWEVDYDYIQTLDAGSFFSKEFKDERIPLLEDVIKFAKENNMKLNIELKPTGREVNFERDVVDVINKYNFQDNCVVTSQNYAVLENIKKVDQNIKTVYVMSFAYGDITNLEASDSFSVEASSVNKVLVKKVHNEGKELYAWTVNTKESINKMINLNVDNIITDNILLAKEEIYKSKTSNIIQEYLKYINKLFG